MPSPIPRWNPRTPPALTRMCPGRLFASDDIGLPCNSTRSASTSSVFEACSAFTRVTACSLAESPAATLCIGVLRCFVTSTYRPDCYRLRRTLAGWDSHPLKNHAWHGAMNWVESLEGTEPRRHEATEGRLARSLRDRLAE